MDILYLVIVFNVVLVNGKLIYIYIYTYLIHNGQLSII